jgi:hypothetical protein
MKALDAFFVFLFVIIIAPSLAFAQVRCGMVTEELTTPDEYGQRAFLTYRASDPYAADIARDSSWRCVDYQRYGFPELEGSNDIVSQIDASLLNSFSKDVIMDLGSYYHIEYGAGINTHNYIEIMPLSLGLIFTVDREGRDVSVAFKYPDIPAYTLVQSKTWRKLDRQLRRRVKWGKNGTDSQALSRFVFPYSLDWFSDLRHHIIIGKPVWHHLFHDELEQ